MAHVFIQLAVSQAGRQAQLTLHTYVAVELLFSTQKTKTSTVVGRSVGRRLLLGPHCARTLEGEAACPAAAAAAGIRIGAAAVQQRNRLKVAV